jgi:membrane protein implicated in regulation of membrane protease activity
MKIIDYVIGIVLVLMGIGCLAMSGSMFGRTSATLFVGVFTQICIWLAVPAIIIGIIYLFVKRRGNQHD